MTNTQLRPLLYILTQMKASNRATQAYLDNIDKIFQQIPGYETDVQFFINTLCKANTAATESNTRQPCIIQLTHAGPHSLNDKDDYITAWHIRTYIHLHHNIPAISIHRKRNHDAFLIRVLNQEAAQRIIDSEEWDQQVQIDGYLWRCEPFYGNWKPQGTPPEYWILPDTELIQWYAINTNMTDLQLPDSIQVPQEFCKNMAIFRRLAPQAIYNAYSIVLQNPQTQQKSPILHPEVPDDVNTLRLWRVLGKQFAITPEEQRHALIRIAKNHIIIIFETIAAAEKILNKSYRGIQYLSTTWNIRQISIDIPGLQHPQTPLGNL